jgi:hypothetical protein
MPEKPRPLSKEQAPDPSDVYERAHPERESGMGRLDNNTRATPSKTADRISNAVTNAQDGSRQINAHDDSAAPHAVGKKKPVTKTVGWEKGKKRKK